ncbi:retrotransposon hot spot (RHS) protein [Trypanosoma cruzi Dm28c]|uniref:Retrotransposon hot spot (RHS) protein n=1 Tax=Trypanosoma cruzi Dm28c TaxID=1416333 RepID=V5BNA2_TRYCR|nr:retrotransposon hot spot (RHS) protein [Trypanosoma cruzi Dm28c]
MVFLLWVSLLLWMSRLFCLPVISVTIFFSYSSLVCWSVFSFNLIQPRKQGETMPPKRNRVQGGNAKSRASAAPQGGRQRRARLESEDVTNQPAATCRRVEKRQQQWTMNSSVKEILLEGSTNRTEMRLNDFLRSNLGGRAAVDEDYNVTMQAFVQEPNDYVQDQRLLGRIINLPAYQALEAINKLHHEGVFSLGQWRGYRRKNTVALLARGKINAALSRAQTSTPVVISTVLRGFYNSVYNASWNHVVKVVGGERTQTGTGMEVKDGEPSQSWTYKEVGRTLEKNDGVQQSGAERLRLMVLTSDKGWPYTWKNAGQNIRDCYVDCEVERVWQIVKGNLTESFSAYKGSDYIPKRHLLIGTPGIGKSMNAGSYLLYQLLHYDMEQLQMVAYVIADQKFLFDKNTKTVKKLSEASSIVDILNGFSSRGVKGYIIYDVAKQGHEPPDSLPCEGWGMIVVTSPNEGNFKGWEKQSRSIRIVMNCPEKDDVKAMCVCMKRNEPTVQAGYTKEVEDRINKLGPLLRYVFDQSVYKDRIDSCRSMINKMVLQDTNYYSVLGTDKMCEGNHVSHKLVKVVRVRGEEDAELPYNALISSHLAELTLCKLAKLMVPNDFNLLILAIKDDLISKALEDHSLFAFLSEAFVNAIIPKLTELKVKRNAPPHLCSLRVHPHERPFKPCLLERLENLKKKIKIECRVLYKPEAKNFPLVDGFFFLDSDPKIMVGLQMTTAGEHHTITSTVKLFKERMAAYFNGWEEFSKGLSWDIIYIQHADSTPMNGWQRCDYVNPRNKTDAEKEIVAFWKGKVHQYQVSVSSRDFPREEAPPIVEEQRQQETE